MLTEAFGFHPPAYRDADLASSDLTDLTPTEYRADAVVVLTNGGQRVLAVVVEVQLGRDGDKRWTWPVYLATLRGRLRCPTVLLVVCVEASTAGWCAVPIDLGHPGWILRPLVLGPDRVPLITDVDRANQNPELAMLSAMAHVKHPDWEKIAYAMITAVKAIEHKIGNLYTDVVLAALPAAARATLEAIMSTGTYEYQSDFARRYFSQGEAAALLEFLEARGIDVPDESRERITGCTDPKQLEIWVRRAATATSVEELFV
jgi:hypothetical protein